MTVVKYRAVVFDIDGVLADNVDRVRTYISDSETAGINLGITRNWLPFFEGLHDCATKEGWPTLVRILHDFGAVVILLTARPESNRAVTETWLAQVDIPWDVLVMRPDDIDSLSTFKHGEMAKLVEEYEVVLAVDDEDLHLAGYRPLDVPCLHVVTGHPSTIVPGAR